MGRPREFDEEEILNLAMRLFWRKGYEATTMSDLVSELGLGRGSIYAAFGDKHQLFLKALDRYLQHQATLLAGALNDTAPALPQLRRLLEVLLVTDASCGPAAGCFSVNSIAELLPHDSEVAALVSRSLDNVRAAFTTQLRRAQDTGELSDAIDAAEAARLLVTLTQGIQITRKAAPGDPALTGPLDLAFHLLAGRAGAATAPTAAEPEPVA
ncbi:TetR/AcrR family transcriptional regulator [Streptacidiphilus rugosus]|uniref:TetR/AcrR family transcriptional regulator n=1 Tax=Streptacidiphilus rugosus TaxID=405783 RepID=UPI000A06E271|nr:TetR/AcrR family transcriptional regulator [Streptacidiphilus rugosus]